AGVNTVIEISPSYQYLAVLEHRGGLSLAALQHAAGCRPSTGERVVHLCGGDRYTVEVNRCPAGYEHLAISQEAGRVVLAADCHCAGRLPLSSGWDVEVGPGDGVIVEVVGPGVDATTRGQDSAVWQRS